MKTVLKNCRVLGTTHDKDMLHDIYVENGIIEKIGLNLEVEGAKQIDVGGHTVMSGLIDMHCNICDPGHEYIEDIATASRAALRGGFTTITCEPNTDPVIDNKTVVEYIVSKSKEKSLVNIYPYGSMSIGCKGQEIAEIGEMYDAGIVGISDGDEFTDSAAFLRNVMIYTKMFDLPVLTHCEDRSLSGVGVMNEGYTAACLGLTGMPREAEEVIVARNLNLAERTGVHLHLSHISTKGSVQLIREAKGRGVPVTCETCPHYFILTEDAIGDYDTFAKVNPPLRAKEDVYAIIEGIMDGTIDVIASGHSPTNMTEKEREGFLEEFQEREGTLVGFCVLGGIFSEGVDLTGESLIGAVIVGTGLPQIGSQREILKEYYDKKNHCGFDYAYRYPGMNKVLQAAGRVIRTKEDKGVILLLDDRFWDRDYQEIFPREWQDRTGCRLDTVESAVETFWKRFT